MISPFKLEPLEDDLPGRETYKCQQCGSLAKYTGYKEYTVEATILTVRSYPDSFPSPFNGISFIDDTDVCIVCSEECFNLFLMKAVC